MMMTNQEKEDDYTVRAKYHIFLNLHQQCYMWRDDPLELLIKYKFVGTRNERRLKCIARQQNPPVDTYIDIIQEEPGGDVCVLIQCKKGCNGDTAVKNISSFRGWKIRVRSTIKGELYYTQNILDLLPGECIHDSFDNRGSVSTPCGTGKMLIAYNASKRYNQIVILSPLRENAGENKAQFKEYGYGSRTLLVDSDGECDPEEIRKFIGENPKCLISATFKSVDIIINVMDDFSDVLFIVDEFHNISRTNMIDDEYNFYELLHSHNKLLFFSSTPRIYNTVTDKDYDMDVFGDVIYSTLMIIGYNHRRCFSLNI